jgi:lysophospholipase L1-like esterase
MTAVALRRSTLAFASILGLGASACSSDQLVAPSSPSAQPSEPSVSLFSARPTFARYVAIGTSISAGVQSDGLIFTSQTTSWPAQLDAAVGRALSQPYIGGTGCASPILTPLLLATRLSGESPLAPTATLSCAPRLPGVTLPVDNVAINGALTVDALSTKPETPGAPQIYQRVLQSGMTQVSTMLARNPTIVSVELGSNEVLGPLAGFPVFPEPLWEGPYDQVLTFVALKTDKAVAVGLIDDLRHVPGIRTGSEIWADAPEFLLFHVIVSPDCSVAPGSTNVFFVPVSVAVAAAAGLASAQHGGPFIPFSCSSNFILTGGQADVINGQMHTMTDYIHTRAGARGFAYFDLSALYDRSDIKGPFSVTKLMTSLSPFGPYFSADGVHPNGAGQTILARAAAQALNKTYGLGIPLP